MTQELIIIVKYSVKSCNISRVLILYNFLEYLKISYAIIPSTYLIYTRSI